MLQSDYSAYHFLGTAGHLEGKQGTSLSYLGCLSSLSVLFSEGKTWFPLVL